MATGGKRLRAFVAQLQEKNSQWPEKDAVRGVLASHGQNGVR